MDDKNVKDPMLSEYEEDEPDIVDFYDDEGNLLQLEVMDYFFHNGVEYAVLVDAEADAEHEDEDCDGECEQDMYIMRVLNTTSEDGEEMEEFLPVEDELLHKLIPIVQERYSDEEFDVDEDDEDDDEDDDDEDDDFDVEDDEEEDEDDLDEDEEEDTDE